MSNYSSSKFYPQYLKYLSEFSQCMVPVLEASYERIFVQHHDDLGWELDRYCRAERFKVEEIRTQIKNEFKNIL